ncbi:MAG: hypothetical protein RL641_275 [Candidatus Parcubacteria bacterium]|jgi:uncharacterized membrane protein YuzA (DUF378 family)
MKSLHKITFTLLVIGGVNWLVFGLFGWDIVGKIFGGMDSKISMIVYVLVGLSALYEIFTHGKRCADCKGKPSMPGQM